jgi:hypothetical protein
MIKFILTQHRKINTFGKKRKEESTTTCAAEPRADNV